MSILRSLVGHFAGLLFPPNFAGLLFPAHFAGLLLPLLGLNTASRAMNRLLYSIIISPDPPFFTKHKFVAQRQRKDQRPFFVRVVRCAGEWRVVHVGGGRGVPLFRSWNPSKPDEFPPRVLEPLLVLAILNLVQGPACCNCGLVIHSWKAWISEDNFFTSQIHFGNCFKVGDSAGCH